MHAYILPPTVSEVDETLLALMPKIDHNGLKLLIDPLKSELLVQTAKSLSIWQPDLTATFRWHQVASGQSETFKYFGVMAYAQQLPNIQKKIKNCG